jgi:hypothetical protein
LDKLLLPSAKSGAGVNRPNVVFDSRALDPMITIDLFTSSDKRICLPL